MLKASTSRMSRVTRLRKLTVLVSLSTVEYTDMAKCAEQVMKANGVDDVVTVIQGAVEEVELPTEDGEQQVVDIIISEWMVRTHTYVYVLVLDGEYQAYTVLTCS